MPRILHLMSSTPDFQAERAAAALRDGAGEAFSIKTLTVGRGGNFRHWAFALATLQRRSAERFDVIHVFDDQELQGVPRAHGVVFSPSSVRPGTVSALQRLTWRNPVIVVCPSAVEQQIFIRKGISIDRCRMIRPPVQVQRLPLNQEPDLRSKLGFAVDDRVFLLPGDPDRLSGHREALWAISILHVLDPRFRALLWRRGNRGDALIRLAEKLHQPQMLTVAEEILRQQVMFEHLTAVADVAIFAPRGPAPLLPLAICMASGMPIVTSQSPWIDGILNEGCTGAVVSDATPRRLAQRILAISEESEQIKAMGLVAREKAQELFAMERIVAAYFELYREIASQKLVGT